jgi:hypothetical protein
VTIAGFYLSPEGVVLGADSTSSYPAAGGMHYFNFNQKLFEVGEGSTLAIATWGLGGLGPVSYRTLIAELGDDLVANPPASVGDVAQRWTDRFWRAYSGFDLTQRVVALHAKGQHDPSLNPPDPDQRIKAEEDEYNTLATGLSVGFCLGGYTPPDRTPTVASVQFSPLLPNPAPVLQTWEGFGWWGVPNLISRLIFGADANLKDAILKSGKWGGTQQDLDDIVKQQSLSHGSLPIREAIDYVHTCIQCTIKAMKFSGMLQVCGGPIEVAAITSDRKFRWVRHKSLHAAISDGGLE